MTAPASEQQDLERVLKEYDKIATSFTDNGLDVAAIASVRYVLSKHLHRCKESTDARAYLPQTLFAWHRPKYAISDQGTSPLQLRDLPEPLTEGASRLCVLPLTHSQRHVAAIADIVKSIKALLPPGQLLSTCSMPFLSGKTRSTCNFQSFIQGGVDGSRRY